MNVIDWLLDSDPAIRWQVMRDLTDAPADEVAAERARVAREGWGAQLLSRPGRRRPLERRDVLPGVDLDDGRAAPAVPVRSRPGERGGAAGDRAGPRGRPVGVRREPQVLPGRGRAVHQRSRGHDRRLLRPGRARHRRPAADRADGRRRLELRAGARLDARLVRLDAQRARGAARVRALDRRRTATLPRPVSAARSTCSSAGCSTAVRWRDRAEALALRRLPELLVLRRRARPRLLPRRAARTRRADGRGARDRRVEAGRRGSLAARSRLPRGAARRPR